VTETKPSKSSRKREHLALQKLGERLIALKEIELADLPIDDDLRLAVLAAARMNSRGALRRQKQLIGKLMRHVDPASLRVELAKLGADDRAAKRLFARAESWRDRAVIEGTIALDALEAESGQADDQLRQLLDELAKAPHEDAERAIRRRIFGRIYAMLEQAHSG